MSSRSINCPNKFCILLEITVNGTFPTPPNQQRRVIVVVVAVSHIQRTGCQLDGQSRSWSAEHGKKNKRKVWQRNPSPTLLVGENKIKITCLIYMPRRYPGLGPSRVRTRICSTRRLGQWVSLRKILCFRVRLQFSRSRCLSLFLAMSSCAYLFFPSRAHEPPPTLRDRINPHLSLQRRRWVQVERTKRRYFCKSSQALSSWELKAQRRG